MTARAEERPAIRIESYEAFRAWTENQPGCWMLAGGVPMPSPSPSRFHQELSIRLEMLLIEAVVRQGRGRVYDAPLDVVLAGDLVYQPDLLVVLVEHAGRMIETHIDGPPDLVIEILSPCTAKLDLVDKRYDYARAGVAEYRIVDPDTRTVEVYERGQDTFVPRGAARRAGKLESALIGGFSVELEGLFADL
jgi:Uma2 family endonuclease